MNFFKNNKIYILQEITIIIVLIILFTILYQEPEKIENEEPIISEENNIVIEDEHKKIHVDIKGSILNPGVYELEKETILNDLINLAGGLTAGASTKYLNLSKKLQDEMVVVIYTDEELESKKNEEKQECYCEKIIVKECIDEKESIIISENKDDGLISINYGSINDLMTLPGIGEIKAQAIIDYRNTNGLFQNIEEIKNVSGISESIYEKISNLIKL